MQDKTRSGMLLTEREKLPERKSQEERHKTPFTLPREPEEQRRTEHIHIGHRNHRIKRGSSLN